MWSQDFISKPASFSELLEWFSSFHLCYCGTALFLSSKNVSQFSLIQSFVNLN